MKSGDRPGYYAARMQRYKRGNIVMIVRLKSDIFDSHSKKIGYTLSNDKIIVFEYGMSDYKFVYSDDSETISIKTDSFDVIDDVSDAKFYYMLDGVYARFSPEAGWIWSDGKTDE